MIRARRSNLQRVSGSGKMRALVRTTAKRLPSSVKALLPVRITNRITQAQGAPRRVPAQSKEVPVEFKGRPYQFEDREFFDYRMEQLHGKWFRGPLDRGPDAIAWLGAAQTFGRYVADPFPAIVGNRLALGTMNLGGAGTTPEYFLRQPILLDEVNRCPVAVIQVMSARGIDNSLFRSTEGRVDGVRSDTGMPTESLHLINDLLAQGKSNEAHRLVRETQNAWVQKMGMLFEAVRCRTILLYISFREPPPEFIVNDEMVKKGFPQLISLKMVRDITPLADQFVSVVSRAGIPQVIRDEDGKIARTNEYYPSPEMHRLAADELTPVVKRLIG
jgi:hypothetical protein